MAEKKAAQKQKREKKSEPVDGLAKYTKQTRSPPRKRRADYSSLSFSSSASSRSNSGSFRHCLFNKSLDQRSRLLSDFYEVPVAQDESNNQNAVLDVYSDSKQKTHSSKTLDSLQEKSQVTGTNSVFVTPGNDVPAETGSRMCWAAEIIEETSSLDGSRSQGTDGYVLLQFYGNHRSAWVDRTRDLSQLEDASKGKENLGSHQRKKGKENLGSHQRKRLGSRDGSDHSNQQDQPSDKLTSSTSSRIEGDWRKRGKSKRKQNSKAIYEEVAYSPKSVKVREIRRLKIMRYLGLTAPIGSPF